MIYLKVNLNLIKPLRHLKKSEWVGLQLIIKYYYKNI